MLNAFNIFPNNVGKRGQQIAKNISFPQIFYSDFSVKLDEFKASLT